MALSPFLEELINAAIADGVITDKERAVLHRKAAEKGIDPDEIDIIIDGRLQQMQNQTNSKRPHVDKCPACGEIMPALSSTCPNCGYVVDDKQTENFALRSMMAEMETELMLFRTGKVDSPAKLEGMIRQATTRYGDNARIKRLILEIQEEVVKHEKKLEAAERARKNSIRGKKMGCLGLSIVFMVIMFISTVSDGRDVGNALGTAFIGGAFWCGVAYYFFFRKRIEK